MPKKKTNSAISKTVMDTIHVPDGILTFHTPGDWVVRDREYRFFIVAQPENIEIATIFKRRGSEKEVDEQLALWLDDIHDGVDELMHQPLSVTHPLAFCAPEVVRGQATAIVIQDLNSGTGPVKLVLSSGDSYLDAESKNERSKL